MDHSPTPTITPARLARWAGVSRTWIYREIRAGRIRIVPGVRPYGIAKAEAWLWLSKRRQKKEER